MSDIFRDWSFGGLIREARHNKKISMRDAAKLVGMDIANYSRLEASKVSPPSSKKRCLEICKALGIEKPEFIVAQAYAFHQGRLHQKFWGEK